MLAVTVTPGGSPALRELPSPTAPPGGVLVRVRAVGCAGATSRSCGPAGRSPARCSATRSRASWSPARCPRARGSPSPTTSPAATATAASPATSRSAHAFVASALDRAGSASSRRPPPPTCARARAACCPTASPTSPGTFVEPLACVLRGIEALPQGDCARRRRGSIGLLAAQALRARGAHVRMLDRDPARAATRPSSASRPRGEGERFRGALLYGRGGASGRARAARPTRARSCCSPAARAGRSTSTLVYRRELRARRRALRRTPRHLRDALALIASGAVDVERAGRLRARARARSPRGSRRYRSREALQGGVRTVIAARFWAPLDVRIEHLPEPEPGRRRGRAARRGRPHLRHRREVLPPRPSGAARPAPAPFGHEYAGVVVACGEDAPFSRGRPRVRRQLGALRRLRAPAPRAARSSAATSTRCSTAPTPSCCACRRASRASTSTPSPTASRPRSPRRSSRSPARCTAPTTPMSSPVRRSRCSAAGRSGACSRSPARRAARRRICSAAARASTAATRP